MLPILRYSTRALLFALVLSAAGAPIYAQTKLTGFSIDYTETRTTQNNQGKTFTRTSNKTVILADSGMKIISKPRASVTTFVIAPCQEAAYFYINNGKEFYSAQEESKPVVIDMAGYNTSTATISYSGDSVIQINGFACRKAIAKTNQGDIEIWYSTDYKIDPGCFSYLLKDLPGLPVRMKYTERPLIVIGQGHDAVIEYNLIHLDLHNTVPWDTIENKSKYLPIADEQERIQIYFRLLMNQAD